jgi:hypothetical protein
LGVRNVNRASARALLLTFGTYAVRNVNGAHARRPRLTKCTGKPSPPPSMPAVDVPRHRDPVRRRRHCGTRTRMLGLRPASNAAGQEPVGEGEAECVLRG